jgi:hypothetical protein
MEQLASDLQTANDQSRQELSEALKILSKNYDGDVADFLFQLPDSLGIQ